MGLHVVHRGTTSCCKRKLWKLWKLPTLHHVPCVIMIIMCHNLSVVGYVGCCGMLWDVVGYVGYVGYVGCCGSWDVMGCHGMLDGSCMLSLSPCTCHSWFCAAMPSFWAISLRSSAVVIALAARIVTALAKLWTSKSHVSPVSITVVPVVPVVLVAAGAEIGAYILGTQRWQRSTASRILAATLVESVAYVEYVECCLENFVCLILFN